jgi:hypothetical protein
MRSIADAEAVAAARVAPPLRRERRERRRRAPSRSVACTRFASHTPLDARDLLGDVGAQGDCSSFGFRRVRAAGTPP